MSARDERPIARALLHHVLTHPSASLGRELGATRLRLGLDLLAVVFGSLRDALMVDYAPKMTPPAAVELLASLRRVPGCERRARMLDVHLVDGVILLANSRAVLERLRAMDDPEASEPLFFDASDGASGRKLDRAAMRGEIAHAATAFKTPKDDEDVRVYDWTEAILKASGGGGWDGDVSEGEKRMDSISTSSDATPPSPTMTGLLLGYPVVYAWSPADDLDGAARRLSLMELTTFKLSAVVDVGTTKEGAASASKENGENNRHVISQYTVPVAETDAEQGVAEHAIAVRKHYKELMNNCEKSGGVWWEWKIDVERRPLGGVAL